MKTYPCKIAQLLDAIHVLYPDLKDHETPLTWDEWKKIINLAISLGEIINSKGEKQ